jgi:hypothetical protein
MNRAKWKTLLYILKEHDSRGAMWSLPTTFQPATQMQVVTYTPPKADFNLDALYAARKAFNDRAAGRWLR